MKKRNRALLNIAQIAIVALAFTGYEWAHTLIYTLITISAVLGPLVIVGLVAEELEKKKSSSGKAVRKKTPLWLKSLAFVANYSAFVYCLSVGSVTMSVLCFVCLIVMHLIWSSEGKSKSGSITDHTGDTDDKSTLNLCGSMDVDIAGEAKKWKWMMDWCRKEGVSSSSPTMWKMAEVEWEWWERKRGREARVDKPK